jgi:membrane-associated protease RseP (regulator of RpoE activity)
MPMDVMTQRDMFRKKWRCVQHLANEFWLRWKKEYLQSLQSRVKWTVQQPNLKVGDIVLVLDERTVRGDWPLGRVLRTYPDDQGVIRSVLVKTRGAERVRPITKLSMMESVEQ